MWNTPIVVKQPSTSINCDNASTSETRINSLEFENVMATGSSETHLEGHNPDPLSILRHLKSKNTDRPIIAQLNINFMAPKFEPLVSLLKDNIDLLMVSETKVDDSYPTEQFKIEGYSKPIRLDRNRHGCGLMIFSRDDLPCHELKSHELPSDVECTFLEIRIKQSKWLIVGGYNPLK